MLYLTCIIEQIQYIKNHIEFMGCKLPLDPVIFFFCVRLWQSYKVSIHGWLVNISTFN